MDRYKKIDGWRQPWSVASSAVIDPIYARLRRGGPSCALDVVASAGTELSSSARVPFQRLLRCLTKALEKGELLPSVLTQTHVHVHTNRSINIRLRICAYADIHIYMHTYLLTWVSFGSFISSEVF